MNNENNKINKDLFSKIMMLGKRYIPLIGAAVWFSLSPKLVEAGLVQAKAPGDGQSRRVTVEAPLPDVNPAVNDWVGERPQTEREWNEQMGHYSQELLVNDIIGDVWAEFADICISGHQDPKKVSDCLRAGFKNMAANFSFNLAPTAVEKMGTSPKAFDGIGAAAEVRRQMIKHVTESFLYGSELWLEYNMGIDRGTNPAVQKKYDQGITNETN